MKEPFKNFILPIFAVCAIIFILIVGGHEKPPQTAYAAFTIDTWKSSGSNSWNTGANWSLGAAPGSSNIATFNNTSVAPCNINTNANVGGINIAGTYTGTITQLSGEPITIGASGFTQAGGTFVGSNTVGDSMLVNGAFTQSGGAFTSTADVLSMASGTFSGGTFNNNSGTVDFFAPSDATTTIAIVGSTTFYNLQFGSLLVGYVALNVNIATTTVLTVKNWFMPGSDNAVPNLNGGEIDVQGNIIPYIFDIETNMTGQGSTLIKLTGTGDQTIGDVATGEAYTGDSNFNDFNSIYLPDLTISKPSGNVILGALGSIGGLGEGVVLIGGAWNNTSTAKTIPASSSYVVFLSYQTGLDDSETSTPGPVITGSSTFSDFGVVDYWPNEVSAQVPRIMYTIATGTVITVNRNFTYDDSGGAVKAFTGGGEIDIKGDITNTSENVWLGLNDEFIPTSTFTIVLNGTGTQWVSPGGSPGNTGLFIQGIKVNKSSGVAYFGGTSGIRITGGLNVVSGEAQVAGAITLEIDGSTSVSAGAVFSDYPSSTTVLILGSPVTNNGLIFFDGSAISCSPPLPNDIFINSTTTGAQVPWSGSGVFVMRYANVADQGGTAQIVDWDGTASGSPLDVGGNWSFPTEPEPQLVQTSTASGGSGTTNLALPAFGFKPRAGDMILVAVSARNQTISAPTDNASNTYTLAGTATFSASPSFAVSLYYAKNIVTSSSLVVTAHGGGGGGQFLSASAFEYTGMNPSTTIDQFTSNTVWPVSSTALTSFSATGQAVNELYFGTMTMAASTTAVSGSGWTAESGITNNNTTQALYNEDTAASSTELTTAATWTSATSTTYAAMMGIFHSPFQSGYTPDGTLDSATFDTGVASGAQLNSIIWQGTVPGGGSWGSGIPVGFQIAVSNSANGPWSYEGPTGDASSYFYGNPGTPIQLLASNPTGLTLFNGYRYFRYRVSLWADTTYAYTPTVTQVSVNWSP